MASSSEEQQQYSSSIDDDEDSVLSLSDDEATTSAVVVVVVTMNASTINNKAEMSTIRVGDDDSDDCVELFTFILEKRFISPVVVVSKIE